MKVGIVVDGDAESQALRHLTRKLQLEDAQVLDPVYANMQPKDTPDQIARAAKNVLGILVGRKVNRIIVLIDREDRSECPSQWAGELAQAFAGQGFPQVSVVVKNRKLENWLIADLSVFRRSRARYRLTRSFETQVAPNRADNVPDAEALLNTISVDRKYHKRRDASSITEAQDLLAIAANSRSFRRFLRVLGHPRYLDQSVRPVNEPAS